MSICNKFAEQCFYLLVAQTISSGDSNDFDKNLKLIIGAGGGVLLLTIIITIFLVTSFRRRKRNKDVEREDNRTETRESDNLISNPLFNKPKEEIEAQTGIERLDFPREDIVHCEDIENGTLNSVFSAKCEFKYEKEIAATCFPTLLRCNCMTNVIKSSQPKKNSV